MHDTFEYRSTLGLLTGLVVIVVFVAVFRAFAASSGAGRVTRSVILGPAAHASTP